MKFSKVVKKKLEYLIFTKNALFKRIARVAKGNNNWSQHAERALRVEGILGKEIDISDRF